MFYTKKHRLPADAYLGAIKLAATVCVEGRKRVFADHQAALRAVDHLAEALKRFNCVSPVFCLMPDHVHVFVEGVDETSRPKDAISRFKFSSSPLLAESGARWQRQFYDHVVRDSEDWRAQVAYTFMNPVRARLVREPGDYPFSGCIGFDRREMLDGLTWPSM